MPKSIDLALTTPPGFASAEEFRALLSTELRELEEKHRAEAASGGRRFLGVSRVLAQSPYARPPSRAPRFDLKPGIAARDKWKRIEALSRLLGFLRAYRAAWAAMRAGLRDVIFPAGTYLLRIQHGVRCAAPG